VYYVIDLDSLLCMSVVLKLADTGDRLLLSRPPPELARQIMDESVR
jgi:hypothetical protein